MPKKIERNVPFNCARKGSESKIAHQTQHLPFDSISLSGPSALLVDLL